MAKLSWDKFIAVHKVGICVFTAAGFKTPSGLAPNNKHWPTAYGMLSLILEEALKGDWTARTEKQVIHILLASEGDLKILNGIFSSLGAGKQQPYPQLCKSNWTFVYESDHYGKFAKALKFIPDDKPKR